MSDSFSDVPAFQLMTDLIAIESNLPVSIEDLSKFVLIGNDKLQAVRAEISAIKKLGLAKEVHEQKLAEGQDIAEMVTLAKIKMGELLNDLPKATKGTGGNRFTSAKDREIETPVDFSIKKENTDNESEQENICTENIEVETPEVKPKSEVIKEIGFTQKQVEQLQQMAKNFMEVAKRFGNRQTSADLSLYQMVAMLALPEGEVEKFIAEQAANGNPVEDMHVRELKAKVAKYKAELEKKNSEVTDLFVEKSSLESTVKTMQKNFDKLTSEKNSLQEQLENQEPIEKIVVK